MKDVSPAGFKGYGRRLLIRSQPGVGPGRREPLGRDRRGRRARRNHGGHRQRAAGLAHGADLGWSGVLLGTLAAKHKVLGWATLGGLSCHEPADYRRQGIVMQAQALAKLLQHEAKRSEAPASRCEARRSALRPACRRGQRLAGCFDQGDLPVSTIAHSRVPRCPYGCAPHSPGARPAGGPAQAQAQTLGERSREANSQLCSS